MNRFNHISDVRPNQDDIHRTETELSIVTDSHRTSAQMEGLSPEAQIQAQTFDRLTELLGQAIPLKPVQWTVPAEQKPVFISRQKSVWSFIKPITTMVVSIGVMIALVLCNQWAFVTQNHSSRENFTQNEESSNDSLSEYNYWGDGFENQLSDFEGEMVCMSITSNEIMPIDSSYLEDLSDSGDF